MRSTKMNRSGLLKISAVRILLLFFILLFSACSGGSDTSPSEDTNNPPQVNAGEDQVISLSIGTIQLNAVATDDSLPEGSTLTYTWTQGNGPGNISFNEANELQTSVTFVSAGSYVLQLTVSDGELFTSDTITITVNEEQEPEEYTIAYFVDFENGNDASDGLSKETAFQHCPGDDNATGISSTTTLPGGSIVYFKGGVVYEGQININWSGTPGNVITYDGNSLGTWGTGKAVSSGNNTRFHAFRGHETNYIAIKNFDLTSFNVNDSNSYHGFIRGISVQNWEITDCIMHNTTGATIVPEFDTEQEQEEAKQAGVYITTWGTVKCSNILISNCEIYAIGHAGIVLNRVDDSIVQNCNIGGIDRGDETGYFLTAISIRGDSNRVTVQDNVIHDGWQYEGDIPEGTICHGHDWIHIYRTTHGHADGIIIQRNFLYINQDFVYTRGGSFGYCEDATNTIYRNNIYLNPHGGNGLLALKQNSSGEIYNNLFVNFDRSPDYGSCLLNIQGGAGAWHIHNNIFVQLGSAPAIFSAYSIPAGSTMDYNLYYSPAGSAKYMLRWGSNVIENYYNLSEWQSEGYETHGAFGNPNFVALPLTGSACSDGDYDLTTLSSLAIDKGTDIEGLVDDIYKGIRSGAIDIGPHEY